MVRETRHLRVGNLPENISEERIKEHFKRYGPVKSVKVVSGGSEDGVFAAVAFVDICSAAKAHKADHRLEERLLKTTYYEPSLTAPSATHYPSSSTSHYSNASSQGNAHLPHGARSPRFSAGLNEDHNSYERSSHFYESRRDEAIGYNGPRVPGLSGGPVGSSVQGGMRRGGYPSDRESDFGNGSRGRVRSYHPPRGHFLTNGRAEPGEYRWTTGPQNRNHYEYVEEKIRRTGQAVSPPPHVTRPAPRNHRHAIPSSKRQLPTSRSGSESPSSSRSSRGSSSSSSTSSSRSSSSRSVSSHSSSRSPHRQGSASQSVSVIPVLSPPGEKRPLAICVKNLALHSTDESLKQGLFHDYKKHGKVTKVRIFGSGSDRYAVVCFKKPEDAEKAFDVSHGKLFFGVKVQVSFHEGLELDESEFHFNEMELDEYHPKATRTLFIGGLNKDVTAADLRKHFEAFGEIIEIDIKTQNLSTFAFCQYSDIRSVVQAVKKMDGEHLGGNRIKLGFGKSMPNNCIWVGGVAEGVTETVLCEHFGRFGSLTGTHINIDREKGYALIAYGSERHASAAVKEMRGCLLGGKKLQIDFASKECQVAFYENLNKHFSSPSERSWERRDPEKFERPRREGAFVARTTQRIQTFTSSRSRSRYDGLDEYAAGRTFDEFADNSYERDLHEYADRQRFENGPSTGATTPASTTPTGTPTAVKHRGFSPVRKCDEKSPHSPRSLVREHDGSSPLMRSYDENDTRKCGPHRPTSDHDSFHSQSPPPRGRRIPSLSPSTSLATSPSREVTVVEDPRRRRPSDYKDIVVRVSDMRRPSDSPVRHRNNHRLPPESEPMDDAESSYPIVQGGRSDSLDPRLGLRRDDPLSSGDERCAEGERPNKKSKVAWDASPYEKAHPPLKFDTRSRDRSPGFRKPFESRKPPENKFALKRESSRVSEDPLRSPQPELRPDPRHREASISGGSDIDESSWRGRDASFSSVNCENEFMSDASPPGTPVRDEREDPPPDTSSRRHPSSFPHPREKHPPHPAPTSTPSLVTSSPLSLPLPKFAQQVRLHLSPRGGGPCSSPRGGGLLRSPTFNTGTNWVQPAVETIPAVEDSDPVPADTPVSPGPAVHDNISDSEQSPEVSPNSTAGDLYERIKALDVKFEKWTVLSRTVQSKVPPCRTASTANETDPKESALLHTRKKRILDLEDLKSQEPSAIMKSLLSKRSVFDEDSERLENISDKYEPRPYSSVPRSKGYSNLTSSVFYSLPNTSHSSASVSFANTSASTCTTIPIPSATPLNSLPGIRRSSASSVSVSIPQATKVSPVSLPQISSIAISSPSSASVRSFSTPKTQHTPVESPVQATTSATVPTSFSSNSTSATTTVSTSVSFSTSIHTRRSSSSSVSTPGPPQIDKKSETPVSTAQNNVSEPIVTVSPDTRVTGSVSVIQTSCSKVTLNTTQSITSSAPSVQQPSHQESNKQLKPISDEKSKVSCNDNEASPPPSFACEKKKVLLEKEQVQNANSEVKELPSNENKIKIKDHINNCSFTPDSFHTKIKNEPCENPTEICHVEMANVHKRRLSSTDSNSMESSVKRFSKSGKDSLKSEHRSLEPDAKKMKLEQEEEKENKSTKPLKERESHRAERRERTKSERKEEHKEADERSGAVVGVMPVLDAVEVKHKKEEKQDPRKLEHIKMEVKEEKEKKRERCDEKDRSLHAESKHSSKSIHSDRSDRHRSSDKGDRKSETVEEKKDGKMEVKEEKGEEKDEKKRELKDEAKMESKEEKLKDYERRRHSEDSKGREERKERSRDRRDRDKVRVKERHRSSGSHADRDNEREKAREREKDKLRLSDRAKEKDKIRHSKQTSKSEERTKHHFEKHSEKKERKESIPTICSPSETASGNISSKKCLSKASKSNSQSSLDHNEDSEAIAHKSHQPSSRSKEVDKADVECVFQERTSKDSSRKKHDSGKSEEKSKSHSSRKISSSHYLKSKSLSVPEEDERVESEELSSEDEGKVKSLQPAKRTKQRATSSSSGSRRGRPKNKSILDTESESADSESDSEHKPKKASYFDIPYYEGNMYDKVKARRVKSEQKRDEDPKQQEMKQKLLLQRSKRSKKPQSDAIASESEETDGEIPKKRGHARINSSSDEECLMRVRRNHLSSEESDSAVGENLQDKLKKKLASKDMKAKMNLSKVHMSDITTDEEVATRHHSGTESDSEPRVIRKEPQKLEDSEIYEAGSRKPPRPALSVSRGRLREKDHKISRIADRSAQLMKENRLTEEKGISLISDEIRQLKPKLRPEPMDIISNKVLFTSDKRKYSDSGIKEKGRKEGRMKAIFGLMSDDSDSNAPPPNLPLTSTDLISATSYRKGSASSGASYEAVNMTPPNQTRTQPAIYESDIDDDFRPATPDLPQQKRIPNSYEGTESDKNTLHHHSELKAFAGHNIHDPAPISKEDIMSPAWREMREQTVKEVVCESSRAASDSGKGSSSGVSTASSSSGSSAEELLLLEASTGTAFREETENSSEKPTSKAFVFSREPEIIKESAPRKDKKKKKKHKDKESSKSHRRSSSKDSLTSHIVETSPLLIDETTSHRYKFNVNEESNILITQRKEKSRRHSSSSGTVGNLTKEIIHEDVKDIKEPSGEEVIDLKKSPPLDMPMIKPDEPDPQTEGQKQATLTDGREGKNKEKTAVDQESAVQSIASTSSPPNLQPQTIEISDGPCSPVPSGSAEDSQKKPSRSNISQEETLNAVAGLLACYNDYPEETSPSQTDEENILHPEPTVTIEDPTDQSEEAKKAAQMLQSEIGVGREPEERDESWEEEPIPLNVSMETVGEPAHTPEATSDHNHTPSVSPAKPDTASNKAPEAVSLAPSVKEPTIQFPDSPSSVQSEPALQIDEDQQLESLDTSGTEEKATKEISSVDQESSSVWNTPESDTQDGKPLCLVEDAIQQKAIRPKLTENELDTAEVSEIETEPSKESINNMSPLKTLAACNEEKVISEPSVLTVDSKVLSKTIDSSSDQKASILLQSKNEPTPSLSTNEQFDVLLSSSNTPMVQKSEPIATISLIEPSNTCLSVQPADSSKEERSTSKEVEDLVPKATSECVTELVEKDKLSREENVEIQKVVTPIVDDRKEVLPLEQTVKNESNVSPSHDLSEAKNKPSLEDIPHSVLRTPPLQEVKPTKELLKESLKPIQDMTPDITNVARASPIEEAKPDIIKVTHVVPVEEMKPDIKRVTHVSPMEEMKPDIKRVMNVVPVEEMKLDIKRVTHVSPIEEMKPDIKRVMNVVPVEEMKPDIKRVLNVVPVEEMKPDIKRVTHVSPIEEMKPEITRVSHVGRIEEIKPEITRVSHVHPIEDMKPDITRVMHALSAVKDIKPEITQMSYRGRTRGRGRRGSRRAVEEILPAGASPILTRSTMTTRNSKNRGRGRSFREEETGAEATPPEQPRRSTRTKRARKHPDMVEHDETTTRRRRGGRGGRSVGDEAALRASRSTSDVYDFRESDEEVGVALGKKNKKEKPATPTRSPFKASEEGIETQDTNCVRKSRRLRERAPGEESLNALSEAEEEGEAVIPPITRSRVKVRKDTEGEDDSMNSQRKSPRSRPKLNGGELEGERENVATTEQPAVEVVQKVETPVVNAVPSSLPVPTKTLIIPVPSPKPYSTSNPPNSSSHSPSLSLSAVPAGISSHPLKVSIVPSTVRSIGKGSSVTCVMSPQLSSSSPVANPLLTVTSVPVTTQLPRENFVPQSNSFTITSSKELISSPLKTMVSINCSPLTHSALRTFPNGKKPDTIPTPLVDPVTGVLTPMKISDEGHYIPIGEHLSKDKLGQPIHQAKVLRAVLPSSISVTTITNSSPSIAVSTVVSSTRSLGLASLPKGVAVSSLPRGSEVSVELVSRMRTSVPSTAANIILSTPKGIPTSFNAKSQITLTSSHSAVPTLQNSVISSHVSSNTANVVTIANASKLFTSASAAHITTNAAAVTRNAVHGAPPAPQVKGHIPAKIQPVPMTKAPGNAPQNINVQSIILTSSTPSQQHRGEYPPPPPPQGISTPVSQQSPNSAPSSIGTVSVSRIPVSRANSGPGVEPHLPEYVSLGVPPRYPDPPPRYREPPIVEVARLPAGSPVAALSPVTRTHEPEPAIITRQHYELHPSANAHNRPALRSSPSAPMPHVQTNVTPKNASLNHYLCDMHKKGNQPQPLAGVGVERYLASPPLHTPPSNQTPPPAHHHGAQRENLQMNPMFHRSPFLVSDPRAVYGEKISNLSPMPMDLKVIEKGQLGGEKGALDEKERHGSGPISLNEYTASRPATVITPHNPSSPHHLPSPHYDRSTDSPQVTMMYSMRYPHYDTNLYPNRAGTPGMEHDSLSRSPAPLPFAPMGPGGEAHHSPRVQMPPGPQFTPQVSPQLPPQADNLQYLLQGYPNMWDVTLGLKNEQARVNMHFISGSMEVARGALPDGTASLIRISQRMRLEQSQLEGVAKKMQTKEEHCILIALPFGRTQYELMQHRLSLDSGFIKYLGEEKRAAGIVNVTVPGSQQPAYIIHIFPPCDFANENLARIAPDLLHGVANKSRLMVVIAAC